LGALELVDQDVTTHAAGVWLLDLHNNLNNLAFFGNYPDAGLAANITGEVVDACWVGSKGFDIYGLLPRR